MFVIIGIVVVVAIGGYFFLKNTASDSYFEQQGVKEGVSEIKDFMVDCVNYYTEDSLLLVSVQGGYFDKPIKYEDLGNGSFVPYYSYEGVKYFPSLKSIEEEMGKAVDDIVGKCVDYAEFTGYDIRYGAIKTNVEIKDEEVEFVVDMPIILETEGHSMVIEMKDYPSVHTSYLKGMYNVAQYYMEDVRENSQYCVNCIGELALANKVYVDILGVDPLTSAVVLSEDSTGEFTYFVFLNKFSEDAFEELEPFGYEDFEGGNGE